MELFKVFPSVCFSLLVATVIASRRYEQNRDQTYRTVWRRSTAKSPYGSRPGNSTETNSCQHVREVPEDLRDKSQMAPDGLDSFYQKYTEAYGIPVLSSIWVVDDALRRACYTLRYLLAGNSKMREAYYHSFGRVAVMSKIEVATDIPDHAHLEDYEWARGLGATLEIPICTGGEENLLCYPPDQDAYYQEDIYLHEVSHGVQSLGADVGLPGFVKALWLAFRDAQSAGLWNNTYAGSRKVEYWAEAVQSYFDVNTYSEKPNGIHGPISTRAMLEAYDPQVFLLIKHVFPCENKYLKRCETTRAEEDAQVLTMNCNEIVGASDSNGLCGYWALKGECDKNPDYMWKHCFNGCSFVRPAVQG